MDKENKQKIFESKYPTLPASIRDLLDSDRIEDAGEEAFVSFNLEAGSGLIIEDEIKNVLFGLSKPETFPARIASVLKLEPNTAAAIGKLVNEKIFQAVQADLLGLNNSKPSVPVQPAKTAPKPVSAELEEDMGLRQKFEEAKSAEAEARMSAEEAKQSLDSELQKTVGLGLPNLSTFQKDMEMASRGETPVSASRKFEFTPKPQTKPDLSNFRPPESPKPTAAELDSAPVPPKSPSPLKSPASELDIAPIPPQFSQPRNSSPVSAGFRQEPDPKAAPADLDDSPVPAGPKHYVKPFTPIEPPRLEDDPTSSEKPLSNSAEPSDEPEEHLNRDEILKAIENPTAIKSEFRPESRPMPKPPTQSYTKDPYREPIQ